MDMFVAEVKKAMGLDDTAPPEVEYHIRTAATFMQGAGVPDTALIADNARAVGCAAIGANDIWQTESGTLKFSDAFLMITAQLRA